MLPDRVSNPGPLTYESGALPIALRGLYVTKVIEYVQRILENSTLQWNSLFYLYIICSINAAIT